MVATAWWCIYETQGREGGFGLKAKPSLCGSVAGCRRWRWVLWGHRWIGPLLYADITYTYLVLDLFTAFPIILFTVGCNGPTKLYPTL